MSTLDDEVLRRHFVAIATSKYDDPTWDELAVHAEVEAVQRWLCANELGSRGFQPRYKELADNPTEDEIRNALRNPAPSARWGDADAAFVFITGHGFKDEDETHYLILQRTERSRLRATALRSAEIIGWLTDTRIRHLVVVVDACYAGKASEEILRLSRDLPSAWLVLYVATKNEEAKVGAFAAALTAFLAELRADVGQQYGLNEYLNVQDFREGVQEKLDELGALQTLTALQGSKQNGPHVCLPNPHHRRDPAVNVSAARHDLALPLQDLQTHWGPRSRGVALEEHQGWLFTGRAGLMKQLIATATNGAPGATVITGGAGSGKSAVLARLVTLSDPMFCARHHAEVAAIPADLRPRQGAVDVAVLATGKLHTQVLAQICHALEVPAPASSHPEPTVEERLHAWHEWLERQSRNVTIVIDALDEATDPHTLVRDVLARLELSNTAPCLRLLVGIRSRAASDRTDRAAAPPDTADLADTAEAALHARRIAVDEKPWWDQHDVIHYVHSVLRHTSGSPYATAPTPLIASVAEALGTGAGRSFLIARIAASSLAGSDRVIAANDSGWLAALDGGLVGVSVFRKDLHTSLRDPEERHRAVVLLRAVAFAKGAGLPWRKIWPLVAHAVDDDGGYYGDGDIARLLASRLGGYLITDSEDDTTVYRLFHDLLRDTLRERWRELLAPPVS
ncbi:hypothetical protein DLJ47_28825 [Micromonospora sp. S4605]|uniref:AAA family ATPase n=1 Tax=Micromonospora sp. S4605 TaxID=1420897 RepID=UPI000D6F7E24|nr:AAA family ATPase [Micromonospora sp. S4605]PWU48195.1 hypothetical protein DLJ47_28825 [Micromonospora sp. S4605]